MNVLWLTSWYPNEINKTNGDFIQRQARATALFCKVDVIHVEAEANNQLKKNIVRTHNVSGNLRETIVLYKKPLLPGKLHSFFKYKKLFKKEVAEYFKTNGLPDVVHVHVAMKAGIIALWLKRKYGLPYIITEHWTIYADPSPHPYKNRSLIFKFYSKKIFKNAAGFLPVSNDLGALVCKNVLPVAYQVVYNVVNVKYFNIKESASEQAFTFIHVSSLKPQKNPEIIIDAFIDFQKLHPRSKLLMVGEVSEGLKEYIFHKKNAANNIEFTGFVEYEQVALYLHNSNAFILFSRYENMPCAVLEALCCGLPVITSNVGGLPEIISEENGIIVNDYNKDTLLKAMIDMHDNYHQYNKKNISDNAIELFSYKTIGNQIKNIYEEVKLRK